MKGIKVIDLITALSCLAAALISLHVMLKQVPQQDTPQTHTVIKKNEKQDPQSTTTSPSSGKIQQRNVQEEVKSVSAGPEQAVASVEISSLIDVPPTNCLLHPGTELSNWLNRGKSTNVYTNESFEIMEHEVTTGEFRDYFVSLSQKRRDRIGYLWMGTTDKPNREEQPVSMIKWRAASDYAIYLSSKTGSKFELPRRQQWMAACVKYAQPSKALTGPYAGEIFHLSDAKKNADYCLLGCLREWSSEECTTPSGAAGHYILGEDYMTDRALKAGEPLCHADDQPLESIGFRLIRLK